MDPIGVLFLVMEWTASEKQLETWHAVQMEGRRHVVAPPAPGVPACSTVHSLPLSAGIWGTVTSHRRLVSSVSAAGTGTGTQQQFQPVGPSDPSQ